MNIPFLLFTGSARGTDVFRDFFHRCTGTQTSIRIFAIFTKRVYLYKSKKILLIFSTNVPPKKGSLKYLSRASILPSFVYERNISPQ